MDGNRHVARAEGSIHLCSVGTWLMMKSTTGLAPAAPALTALKVITGLGAGDEALAACWACWRSVPVVCSSLEAALRAVRRAISLEDACMVTMQFFPLEKGVPNKCLANLSN